jgi:hypothetical protein
MAWSDSLPLIEFKTFVRLRRSAPYAPAGIALKEDGQIPELTSEHAVANRAPGRSAKSPVEPALFSGFYRPLFRVSHDTKLPAIHLGVIVVSLGSAAGRARPSAELEIASLILHRRLS